MDGEGRTSEREWRLDLPLVGTDKDARRGDVRGEHDPRLGPDSDGVPGRRAVRVLVPGRAGSRRAHDLRANKPQSRTAKSRERVRTSQR